MRKKDVKIGKYYRLSDTPNYGYVKILKVLDPGIGNNKTKRIVAECEHVSSINSDFGFLRTFYLSDILKGE